MNTANTVQLEERRSIEESEWVRVVEACNGNALHLPATHLLDYPPESLRFLLFKEGETVVACALGLAVSRRLMRRIPVGPGKLVLPTAPALADAVWAEAVLTALEAHARLSGYARLVVQPQSSAYFDRHELFARHAKESLIEFVLDLRRQHDEVLQGMHKTHRKNARRAEARGVTVVEDSSLEGLLRLRAMQEESSQRAAKKEHGFSVREETFFRKAHEHVYSKGLGRVLFAKRGDELLAGLAFLTAARRAVTVRSGSFPAGYEMYAMYLLYVKLIQLLLDQGAVELNLGGVPLEAANPSHPQWGLHEFKKGFGGCAVTRAGVDLPLRGER